MIEEHVLYQAAKTKLSPNDKITFIDKFQQATFVEQYKILRYLFEHNFEMDDQIWLLDLSKTMNGEMADFMIDNFSNHRMKEIRKTIQQIIK